MKPSSLAIVPLLALGLAACQRQEEPSRRAVAEPTPSPVTASAPPLSAAPGDTLPPSPVGDSRSVVPAEAPAAGRIDPATGVRIEDEPAQRSARRGTTVHTAPPARGVDSLPLPQNAPTRSQNPPAPRTGDVETTVHRSEEAIVLPSGTELPIRLGQTLASDTSRPEQDVRAELTDDVRVNGRLALPAGTEVLGHVVVAQQSGRVQGRARLVVAFDELRLRNRSYPIQAWRWDVTAESSRDRDAKIAGGAAAAGAIIGAITGGGKGALKGGLLGGAAGGAAVLVTRGKEVELRSGAAHKITLRQSLRIE